MSSSKLHVDNIPGQNKKDNPSNNYLKEIFGGFLFVCLFFWKEGNVIMHFEMINILKKINKTQYVEYLKFLNFI